MQHFKISQNLILLGLTLTVCVLLQQGGQNQSQPINIGSLKYLAVTFNLTAEISFAGP